MGAFFLAELDRALERTGLFFIRYMDDVIVLAPTRWSLRRAVRIVNEHLNRLGLEKAPDKTFIDRVASRPPSQLRPRGAPERSGPRGSS